MHEKKKKRRTVSNKLNIMYGNDAKQHRRPKNDDQINQMSTF